MASVSLLTETDALNHAHMNMRAKCLFIEITGTYDMNGYCVFMYAPPDQSVHLLDVSESYVYLTMLGHHFPNQHISARGVSDYSFF